MVSQSFLQSQCHSSNWRSLPTLLLEGIYWGWFFLHCCATSNIGPKIQKMFKSFKLLLFFQKLAHWTKNSKMFKNVDDFFSIACFLTIFDFVAYRTFWFHSTKLPNFISQLFWHTKLYKKSKARLGFEGHRVDLITIWWPGKLHKGSVLLHISLQFFACAAKLQSRFFL